MYDKKMMLRIIGLAFIAFIAVATTTSPLASGDQPPFATKPPSFQVLANNFQPTSGGNWIGGVAGYSRVTIVLSASCASASQCLAVSIGTSVVVSVLFQTGVTIQTPTLSQFTWNSWPAPMAQTYNVPYGASTILITAQFSGTSTNYAYSIAISLA